MEIEILGNLERVEIGASGIKEIIQNVKTIVSTSKWTVPMDRDFGLTADMVDDPAPVAQARLTGEIVDAIETYEPRARVVSVSFVEDEASAMDGRLVPQVRLKIDASS